MSSSPPHEARDLLEDVLVHESTAGRLRDAGLKVTHARQHVLDVLAAHEHLNAEQVHHYAERAVPGLSLSTAYRTLDTLCDAALVGTTQMRGTRTYHLAGHRGHAHLTCRSCGAVLHVDADDVAPFAADLAQRHGFMVDIDHLVLLGTCVECRTTA